MRGLILAAGRGRRLGAVGEGRPKCLVPVAGHPLLEWQRQALEEAGIVERAIVCGYAAERLPLQGWTRFVNWRWEATGVVASLRAAGVWLRENPCVVSYADIVYGPEAIAALRDTPGDIAITSYLHWRALWTARFPEPLLDAETFEADATGRLLTIGERPRCLDDIQGQFMGLVKFTPAGFARILHYLDEVGPAAADRLDMTGLLRGLIQAGYPVQSRSVDTFWYEIDNVSDLELFPAWASRAAGGARFAGRSG
jgi:L-glutamine-phosphate cytidylyltransferase